VHGPFELTFEYIVRELELFDSRNRSIPINLLAQIRGKGGEEEEGSRCDQDQEGNPESGKIGKLGEGEFDIESFLASSLRFPRLVLGDKSLFGTPRHSRHFGLGWGGRKMM